MKIITGSICAAQGFMASGVYAGIKRNQQKKDIAIIYSQTPTVAAGVFTTNQIVAAPVVVTQKHINNNVQAVVINSGNANACTGVQGTQDAWTMAEITAAALNLDVKNVAVASTGVIGVPLPMNKISAGIPQAVQQLCIDAEPAAQAILTTDTFIKSVAVEFILDGKPVRIGGIAKGSGMIHPMMATMLAFITTDAAINQAVLQQALIRTNEDSFHMISVDGDSSTNDMALVLANGMAENKEILSLDSKDGEVFLQALTFVCKTLAKQIAQDGEGATKLIEMTVSGAATIEEARIAARAVCRSSLVKSAVFGEDANWGRIAAALGAAAVQLNPDTLEIAIGDVILFKQAQALAFDESVARSYLQQKTVQLSADLGVGAGQATAWGCDLTYDYVKINASYRS